MPRLFMIYRTYDRIWTCQTLTRELAPFEMDRSKGPIKFVFHVDQLYPTSNLEADKHDGTKNKNFTYNFGKTVIGIADDFQAQPKHSDSFYYEPHERLWPSIVGQKQVYDNNQNTKHSDKQSSQESHPPEPHQLLRRYSVPSVEVDPSDQSGKNLTIGDNSLESIIYFVLPARRCTLLLDAHLASCLQCECSKSKAFRRRFLRSLRRSNGFRNCIPDYEKWAEEDKEAWERYLQVPYLLDVVALWPKQKVDYAWCDRVLGNLNKHVVLAEGFAWLSTLGGAHSSLGETFLHHAQRAGEISGYQLRLALQTGNESLIARCYVFWSWSLLQRGCFKQCKGCVLKTWRFCKGLKGRDRVLENMCKAVWSRLRYRLALSRGKVSGEKISGSCTHHMFELRDDSSDSGDESDRVESSTTSSSVSNAGLASSRIVGKGNRRIVIGNSVKENCTSRTMSRPLGVTIQAISKSLDVTIQAMSKSLDVTIDGLKESSTNQAMSRSFGSESGESVQETKMSTSVCEDRSNEPVKTYSSPVSSPSNRHSSCSCSKLKPSSPVVKVC